MNGVEVLTLILTAAGGGLLAAIANAIFNRKKLSAEATEIITKAAAGTVENIMADNATLRTKIGELEGQMAKLIIAVNAAEQRERAHDLFQERYRWHLDRWHRYCGRLSDELRALGGQIEDPPPMWPEPILPDDIRDP